MRKGYTRFIKTKKCGYLNQAHIQQVRILQHYDAISEQYEDVWDVEVLMGNACKYLIDTVCSIETAEDIAGWIVAGEEPIDITEIKDCKGEKQWQ